MNVAKLITILQTLPMDSQIQISYFGEPYESARVDDVRTLTFREAEKSEKFPETNRPNRVILS